MRLPLFLKILAATWATVILSLLVAKVTFPLFGANIVLTGGSNAQITAIIRRHEAEADVALRYGGEKALRDLIAAWPPNERAHLHVVDSPGGKHAVFDPPRRRTLGPVGFGFAFCVFASLAFSVALAAYVTWPIGRLRRGFRGLAEGALATRLGREMGGRRDEIADLASEFDSMAERLQHVVSTRDRLLHDVSHELRSPLARMRVAMDLARQKPERTAEVLARIAAEEGRLNSLIGDLLNLSRAENGLAGEQLYFDVASLLEVICADASFEAQPRQVGVDLVIAKSLKDPARAPVIAGDPELIRRALENVVRNAIRFSPAGSPVRVDARLEDGRIVIEVRDNGPGASPEVRAIMFEPFAKGADAASGAGLGLAIAKRAVTAHGGQIEAVKPEKGGMLVRMSIPPAELEGRTGGL